MHSVASVDQGVYCLNFAFSCRGMLFAFFNAVDLLSVPRKGGQFFL